MTLRYPYEVRDEKEYFDDIADEQVPDMLELAHRIVESKSGQFMPRNFQDGYEIALRELIQKKQAGQPIQVPDWREPARVINLMDALRRSVEASRAGEKPAAPSVTSRRAKAERSNRKIAPGIPGRLNPLQKQPARQAPLGLCLHAAFIAILARGINLESARCLAAMG